MPDWQAHKIMMPGRIAVLLLLLAGLLQPARVDNDKVTVAVLIDQSARMTPASIVDLRERLARDLDDDDVSVVAASFDASHADQSLDSVLRRALLDMKPNPGNSVVIASHGYWPEETRELLQQMHGADLAVYWLPADTLPDDPRITAIDAPAAARAGQEIAVSVTTTSPGGADFDVLLFANQVPVGRAPAESTQVLTVTLPESGSLLLSAELVRRNDGNTVSRLDDAAIVNVISPPTMLLVESGPSPLGDSLAAGGWPLTRVSPSGFPAFSDDLGRFDALILDNVAANSISSWSSVNEAVRRNGMGLIVLGGPNAFALGAYRNSSLEELLPLISEPPRSEKPVSVEFLVDISGSMGSGNNKLGIARAAVLETASTLRPVDRVGLVAFDVDARRLLRLANREDHRDAIRQAWPVSASGGTVLGPALQRGMSELESVPAEQKILMLVTDGMLADEDVGNLERRLAESDIELIAIVVDPDAATGRFERIEASERAEILVIDDVMRLPVLMRAELESRREPVVTNKTTPLLTQTIPFFDATSWPSLDAYIVTRPRIGARIMLSSPGGDPLMASTNAGAGRVVALTGGLGQWAPEWLAWNRWPGFAAGLASYVAVRSPQSTGLMRTDGALRFDAVNTPVNAMLLRPDGTMVEFEPSLAAPRRYELAAPPTRAGKYSLIWESDDQLNRFSFVKRPEPVPAGQPAAGRYVEQGLLREWTSSEALLPRSSARRILLLFAIAVLLLTITLERVPLGIQKR